MLEIDHHDGRRTIRTAGPIIRPAGFGHVMACLDTSATARAVLEQATAIAEAMGARLTLLRVLEPLPTVRVPPDPVEWNMVRCGARAELADMANEVATLSHVETAVLDGHAADTICRWAAENEVDLTVLGIGAERGWADRGLSGTARLIVENATGSVMLVPLFERHVQDAPVSYNRIMVPLDSSSQGQAALPVAALIASHENAELLLVHAVPNVELTISGPLEAEDIELRDRLRQRNELAAQRYLRKLLALMPQLPIRTRLLSEDDHRDALARAISAEKVDLLVLSCRGLSRHTESAIGSTAEYLMSGARIPVLLVRTNGVKGATASRRRAGVVLRHLPASLAMA